MATYSTYTELFKEKIAEKIYGMILPYKDILSRDIHMECGGYPGPKHHMPQCCDAMYQMMAGDDEIISAPPSGKGAYVKVRYYKRNHPKKTI